MRKDNQDRPTRIFDAFGVLRADDGHMASAPLRQNAVKPFAACLLVLNRVLAFEAFGAIGQVTQVSVAKRDWRAAHGGRVQHSYARMGMLERFGASAGGIGREAARGYRSRRDQLRRGNVDMLRGPTEQSGDGVARRGASSGAILAYGSERHGRGTRSQATQAFAVQTAPAAAVEPSRVETAKGPSPDGVPEKWQEYFNNLEVMIFSGSANSVLQPRSVDEFNLIADQCIQQSHEKLLTKPHLVKQVLTTLSKTSLMPWGGRLPVQGNQAFHGTINHEGGKVNELLCLLRAPQTEGVQMGNHWIGIVRHDYTPYMTGRILWLVGHLQIKGNQRHLLFARDMNDKLDQSFTATGTVWDEEKVKKFNELISQRESYSL